MFSANGGGLKELERRVCWRTSSTQASPSGLIEICLERGLGPARPSGVELESCECPATVFAGEWSPKEWLDDADRRRRPVDAVGGDVKELSVPVVTDLGTIADASDALDPRRTLWTVSDEGGRALKAEGGRDGVARPDVWYDNVAGVSMVPGE